MPLEGTVGAFEVIRIPLAVVPAALLLFLKVRAMPFPVVRAVVEILSPVPVERALAVTFCTVPPVVELAVRFNRPALLEEA